MSEPVEWKKQQERGSRRAYQTAVVIYKLLGRRLCSLIIYPVSLYFCATGKKARLASIDYLTRVFQHPQGKQHFKRPPGFAASWRHVRSFSLSILDKFAVWLGRVKYEEIAWPERQDFVDGLKDHGVVLLSAHYGNLEIMRAVSRLMTHMKVNVIMDKKNAVAFNNHLQSSHTKVDLDVFATDDIDINTAVLLKEKLAQGEMVAIMADRLTDGSLTRFLERPFIGETARFPEGPFAIAAILKAPVYMFICSKKKNHFHVNVEKMCNLDDFSKKKRNVLVAELCDQYVEVLEKHCLEDPWQWYNFYNFWKKTGETDKTAKR
jgi:predicted LPLAT superfamily acyltransferase